MLRLLRRLVLPAALVAAAWYAWARFGPYDPAPWLADLDTLEAHTAAAYANLDWQAAQGVVDPVALHRRTDSLIRNATHAGAARRALVEFGRAFGDGHYSVSRPQPGFVVALERLVQGGGGEEGVTRELGGPRACARLGYGTRNGPSLLAAAPGWREVVSGPFQAGLVPLPDGRTAGGTITIASRRPLISTLNGMGIFSVIVRDSPGWSGGPNPPPGSAATRPASVL